MSLDVLVQEVRWPYNQCSLGTSKAALLYADQLSIDLPDDVPEGASPFFNSSDAAVLELLAVDCVTSNTRPADLEALDDEKEWMLDLGAHMRTSYVPPGCIPMGTFGRLAFPLPGAPAIGRDWMGRPARYAYLEHDDLKRFSRGVPGRKADRIETALAEHLLAELPAFPAAELADILDVRDRLAAARIRFRSALSGAARLLAQVPENELEPEILAYRRERVDGALVDIEDELKSLGAVPTLLRVARDTRSVATMASIAIAATMLDVGAVAMAAATTTGLATVAREALERREIARTLRRQPYWYLREVERELGRRR